MGKVFLTRTQYNTWGAQVVQIMIATATYKEVGVKTFPPTEAINNDKDLRIDSV